MTPLTSIFPPCLTIVILRLNLTAHLLHTPRSQRAVSSDVRWLRLWRFRILSPELARQLICSYFGECFNKAGIATRFLWYVDCIIQPPWLRNADVTNVNGVGLGAFTAPLLATYFSVQKHWYFHYLISAGFAVLNIAIIWAVFRGRTANGTSLLDTLQHHSSRF